jgi:hypothetical protein
MIAPSFYLALSLAQEPAPAELAEPAPAELVQVDAVSTEAQLQLALDRLEANDQRLQALERQLALEAAHRDTGSPIGEAVVVGPELSLPEAVAFGAPVHVHGQVTGKAVSFGGDVRVFNGGQVEGDAVSFGGRVIVEPGGVVEGDRISYAEPNGRASAAVVRTDTGPRGWLRDIARKLVMLLTVAGAGVLVVGLFPRHVANVAGAISDRPMRAGLAGAGWTLGAVIVATILGLTVLLSPVAIAVALGVGVAWLLGFVGLCQALGDRLPIANPGLRRWLAFFVGVTVLTFVGSLPWVGQVLLVLVGLVSVGAALQTRFGTRELD